MATSLAVRWNACRNHIQARLAGEDASAWLPLLELTKVDAGQVVLSGVPNSFFRTHIALKFLDIIREGLAQTFPEVPFVNDFSVELRVGPAPAQASAPTGPLLPEVAGAAGPGAAPAPLGRLETRLTFTTFQEGSANRIAANLARQVAADPGRRYNPLLLVGASGFGKTHLLQAVTAQVAASRPGWRIRYCTAEDFANEVWEGIRLRRMPDLRARFRPLHLLALDDLEFLQGKPKAQEELVYTLDALHGKGHQLIFSARAYPRAMAGIEPALRSRLEMGLVTELEAPDAELRCKIVRARAAAEGLRLTPEAEALLVERITSSPRQLEGALVRVAAYASLLEETLTADFVRRVAEPCFDPEPGTGLPVTAERILEAVCDRFALPLATLRSRNRTATVVAARQVAAFLLRELGQLSFPEIGVTLGHRHHSTMIQTIRVVQRALPHERRLRNQVQALREELAPNGAAARETAVAGFS